MRVDSAVIIRSQIFSIYEGKLYEKDWERNNVNGFLDPRSPRAHFRYLSFLPSFFFGS